MVFSKEWFEKHQYKLLWLLNNKLTRRWFRWCLRIDCSERINRITPNSYTYGAKKKGKKVEMTTDFRTHDKYSKRLYYAFKPLWYTMHFLDWVMLDRVEALTHLSFGFSTLTKFPGTIATDNPADGRVGRTGVSNDWATIRAGAGNSVDYTTNGLGRMSLVERAGTAFAGLERSIFGFDTSALTAGATISAATFSLTSSTSQTANDIGGTWEYNVYAATPGGTAADLEASDYGQIGSTALCDSIVSYTTWASGSAYRDWEFNATGIAAVSKTGITQIGLRNSNYDVSGTTPGGSGSNNATYISGQYANDTAETPDPRIVITYTTIPPNNNFLLMF